MANNAIRLAIVAFAAVALLGSAVTADAQQPRKSVPAKKAPLPKQAPLPKRDAFIMMTRTVLIALHHGNLTGNYSVLRELGSPFFQNKYSSAALFTKYLYFRRGRINLSPVALFVPRLTQPPKYVQRGVILLSGFFPTKPKQVKFELYFQVVRGAWRIHEIQITVV